jgi:hypothetical protein
VRCVWTTCAQSACTRTHLVIVFLSTFHIEFFKQICLLHSSDVMFSDHNLNQAPELQIDVEDDGKRRDPEIQIQKSFFRETVD